MCIDTFRYIQMSDTPSPGIFRFWFNHDANTTGSGYILSACDKVSCSDIKEPIVTLSPEELTLLVQLADRFSEWSSETGSAEKNSLSYNGQKEEAFIRTYFMTLIVLFNSAAASEYASLHLFRGYCRILEELLFLNTERIKTQNQYSISSSHPIMLMQNYVESLTKDEINLLKLPTSKIYVNN